ncbi:DUF6318 family protein [Sinomonas gamaensis]|uniref:DUF6318 family protein n=1 Tax=Sinomonas gamaensis TaxID=2565624 RepID=UPI001109AA09|nr:DUF6318 family protein [Sinomonas gamaensis]
MAAVVGSMLVLVACDPAASPEPSSSAPPTQDLRPTQASSLGPARNLPKPVLPESARQNTKEGFEAFTQYWFDTITYGLETGDSEPLREVSLPDCKMCNGYIADAGQVARGERRHVGPRWTVSSFEPNMILDPNRNAIAYFFLHESPSQVFDSTGELVDEYSPGVDESPKVIHATYKEGRWLASQAGQA